MSAAQCTRCCVISRAGAVQQPLPAAAARSVVTPHPTRRQPPLRRPLPPAASSSGSSSSSAAPAAPAANVSAALETLQRACRTKAVPPEQVLAAIAEVEAAHAQQSLVAGFPAALTGTWRLVFSSPSPIKAWQYIPVLEDAVIDVAAGTVDLVSVVGPLDNAFKGACTFEADPSTGTYAMHFGFNASEAKWFGRWETRKEFDVKSKTYSFFLLTDDLAVANSSGSPKTLMYRVK